MIELISRHRINISRYPLFFKSSFPGKYSRKRKNGVKLHIIWVARYPNRRYAWKNEPITITYIAIIVFPQYPRAILFLSKKKTLLINNAARDNNVLFEVPLANIYGNGIKKNSLFSAQINMKILIKKIDFLVFLSIFSPDKKGM